MISRQGKFTFIVHFSQKAIQSASQTQIIIDKGSKAHLKKMIKNQLKENSLV